VISYVFVSSWTPPCWLIIWFVQPLTVSFLPVIAIRATILLCQVSMSTTAFIERAMGKGLYEPFVIIQNSLN
jgi:hypothetical protein